MENNHQLVTRSIDLLAPPNRFVSSSRLYGRLHRWQLLIRRFWWLVGLILVLVLAPVYLYTSRTPPEFQSKARLWLAGKLNLSEGRLYTEELIDYLATQCEVLSSPTLQQRALARLRSHFKNDLSAVVAKSRKPAFPLVHNITTFLKGLAGLDTGGTNAPSETIPFAVKATEASKSSILELRATGTDPAATRAFLNCLIDEYFAFKKENRQKASDETLTSVTGEVHQLAEELKAQQAKLHAFQSTNNVVFLQEQGSSAGSYLGQINRQLATLRTQLQLLQRLDPEQWMDVESRRATGSSGEAPDPAAAQMLASLAGPQADLFKASQQMALLKAKRDELLRYLRPEHPKIIKLNEDIANEERLVEISRQEALKQLATRRQALEAEVKNLEAAFAQWDLKAIDSSRKIADYDSMRQELQRLQNAYDRVFGLMQTVDIGKTVDQENVGVLEPASVARPVPRMIINMLLALFAALVLSFACLYCLGMFDDRFASLTEVAGYFSEEVLAQIPAISLKNGHGQMGIQFLERQRFEFLESFRNLRSSLLYMANGERRPKTILITSSVPKEGKSTVALYLAATLAMGNSRVLLIDGDMRRSSLHKYFAASSGPGLAEILSREASPVRAIIHSSIENLSLLPAGTAKRNPGELVLSAEWVRFVSEVYPQFDYILIDSPPLLATDDAASLAPRVDGVVMIVRGCFTSARMARRALDLLRQRQAHVLGLVFNRVLSSASEYHYYQHYRHAYGWRPRPQDSAPELVYGSASPVSNTHQAG